MNPLVGWWYRKTHLYEIYIRWKPNREVNRSAYGAQTQDCIEVETQAWLQKHFCFTESSLEQRHLQHFDLGVWSNQNFSELAVRPNWDCVIQDPSVQMEGRSRRSASTAALHQSDGYSWVARRKTLLCKRRLKAPKTPPDGDAWRRSIRLWGCLSMTGRQVRVEGQQNGADHRDGTSDSLTQSREDVRHRPRTIGRDNTAASQRQLRASWSGSARVLAGGKSNSTKRIWKLSPAARSSDANRPLVHLIFVFLTHQFVFVSLSLSCVLHSGSGSSWLDGVSAASALTSPWWRVIQINLLTYSTRHGSDYRLWPCPLIE